MARACGWQIRSLGQPIGDQVLRDRDWTPGRSVERVLLHKANLADGTGGFAIIEADSAAALAKASAPFTPWLRFTGKPILPIEEAAAIAGERIALREAVR